MRETRKDDHTFAELEKDIKSASLPAQAIEMQRSYLHDYIHEPSFPLLLTREAYNNYG
jgi:hypothetical protein